MAKFLNVLMEERKEKEVDKTLPKKKGYDWRYENSIVSGKSAIEVDGEYSQWRTNSILKNHKDLIFFVNEMNINYNITNQMHYDYLFSNVRKQKRWSNNETKEEKKVREEKEALLELISDYYKYNNVRSREALKILTPEQIEIIKNKNNKGGLR